MWNNEDFATMFRATYPSIVRDVDFILGDADRAEELTQEAFVRAHLRWTRVRDMESPAGWVRVVAVRLAYRHLRREALFHRHAQSNAMERHAVSAARELDVRAAVASLPPAQRIATVLFYFEDLPITEVSATLRCTSSTAKAHLFKARNRLALLLGPTHGPQAAESP